MTNASSPIEGVVTAGQPKEEELARLAEAGFRTVVDLRTSGEDRGFVEPEAVRGAGMEYVSIPVDSDDPESFDDDDFDRFRRIMTERGDRPVLVHCRSATRVGTMMIPYLMLDEGKGREEAVEIASRIGPEKEDLTRRALRYAESR